MSKQLVKSWENIKRIFHHPGILYIFKILCSKLICCYYNNFLVDYFAIKKTYKLLAKKYYELTFCKDLECYVNDFDICLVLKAVQYKLYRNFQFLLELK